MNTAPIWVAIALGGALGSVARYGVGLAVRGWAPGWPWGTLAVNLLGSFLIGALVAAFEARPVSDVIRLGLVTGVLGGFTTFSAFSLETLQMWRAGETVPALLYAGGSVVLGLAACAAGFGTVRASLG